MTERPETVGDLDPDREIISVQNSDIVHLVDADCHAKLSIERGRVTTAAAFQEPNRCRYVDGDGPSASAASVREGIRPFSASWRTWWRSSKSEYCCR